MFLQLLYLESSPAEPTAMESRNIATDTLTKRSIALTLSNMYKYGQFEEYDFETKIMCTGTQLNKISKDVTHAKF